MSVIVIVNVIVNVCVLILHCISAVGNEKVQFVVVIVKVVWCGSEVFDWRGFTL